MIGETAYNPLCRNRTQASSLPIVLSGVALCTMYRGASSPALLQGMGVLASEFWNVQDTSADMRPARRDWTPVRCPAVRIAPPFPHPPPPSPSRRDVSEACQPLSGARLFSYGYARPGGVLLVLITLLLKNLYSAQAAALAGPSLKLWPSSMTTAAGSSDLAGCQRLALERRLPSHSLR